MMTPYDVRARVVECANCGAPLTIIDPSTAKCGYCGTHNQVSERPNDGRGPLAPAQEVARLAQLKAQQEHPLVGHVYDLTGLPPSLMFEGATAESVNDLAALHRLWSHAKTVAPDGLEPQRGLCWVAIHSARLLSNSEQYEGARAKLETALNHLSDPGHRLLIRAELCLEAIQRGELAAARGWLAECDPAPEVLELDSALRYATARVCLAESNPARALSLVGEAHGALPVQKAMAPHFMLVRITAFELSRRFEEAAALWSKYVAKFDEAKLIDIAQREGLALQTRLGPMQRSARDLATQIDGARGPAFPFASALAWAPFITLLVALVFSVEGCATKRGPLLGTVAIPVCGALCDICQPPATYHYWSANGSGHHAVLCDSEALRPSQMESRDLMQHASLFPHLEVPGGGATMYAVTYIFVFPLGLLLGFALALSKRRRLKAKLETNQTRLSGLEPELNQAGREAGPLPRRWLAIVLISALFLLSMAGFAGAVITKFAAPAPAAAQP